MKDLGRVHAKKKGKRVWRVSRSNWLKR